MEVGPFDVSSHFSIQPLVDQPTNFAFSYSAGGVLKDNYSLFGLKRLKGKKLEKAALDYLGVYSTKNLDNIVFTDGPILINIPHAVHHEDLRATGRPRRIGFDRKPLFNVSDYNSSFPPPSSPTGALDPKNLIEVRKQELKIIQKWIWNYRSREKTEERDFFQYDD